LQNGVAQALRKQRYLHGALNIETIEVTSRPAERHGRRRGQAREESATDLIEDFMIAANEV